MATSTGEAAKVRRPVDTLYVPPFLSLAWWRYWDLIVPMTSAGKDSTVMKAVALPLLAEHDLLDRTAVLHIDLGETVEWPQVPELAAEQAARLGVPLFDGGHWGGRMHYTRRPGPDLLDDFATRLKRDGTFRGFPTLWTRYCTADHKTAPGRAFIEMLCALIREQRQLHRPVRVLQIMGFRAAESRDRAKRWPFDFKPRLSTKKRHIFEWLPVHDLSTAQVWDMIHDTGLPYHPVYDEGLTRLSCRHCPLASKADLARSKRLSPGSSARLVQIEQHTGDSFQQNRPFASIEPEPGRTGLDVHWLNCPTCGVRVLAQTWEKHRYCPRHAARGPWDDPAAAEEAFGCGRDPMQAVDWDLLAGALN